MQGTVLDAVCLLQLLCHFLRPSQLRGSSASLCAACPKLMTSLVVSTYKRLHCRLIRALQMNVEPQLYSWQLFRL